MNHTWKPEPNAEGDDTTHTSPQNDPPTSPSFDDTPEQPPLTKQFDIHNQPEKPQRDAAFPGDPWATDALEEARADAPPPQRPAYLDQPTAEPEPYAAPEPYAKPQPFTAPMTEPVDSIPVTQPEPQIKLKPEPEPEPEPDDWTLDRDALEKFLANRAQLNTELGKVIVGQERVIEELMIVLFAGGHCLISGAPGLAKTLLIRTLAQIMDLNFKRIQFTPDLMPADITGTEIITTDAQTGNRALTFVKGPVFTNVLLADEINRTPPKTQAALLEAMEEKQITAAGVTHKLDHPFFVFATQNPIELEGTYPLPEAQLDRFMFKILIDYLDEDHELAVATRTTTQKTPQPQRLFSAADMTRFSRLVRLVPVAEPIARYAVRLVRAGRPGEPDAPDFVKQYVGWGPGTRASQNMILAAKSRAMLKGRLHTTFEDIRAVAGPVLRHRILTNFRADADRIQVEEIITRLLEHVPQPRSGLV